MGRLQVDEVFGGFVENASAITGLTLTYAFNLDFLPAGAPCGGRG